MNNKKVIISIIVVVVIIAAIGFGIFKATHNEDYLYNNDGTIVDGKKDLINRLKSIKDANERKNQVDFSVQQNIVYTINVYKLFR